MYSKISSDWPPSYMKDKRPVLEIFKMAGYLPDSLRNVDPFYQMQQFDAIMYVEMKMNQAKAYERRKDSVGKG